ncbi:MAG: DUF951 domain-containing protein [Peptoniphilaceae bacterium]|nr:DUF951 domain-containing protein [Peptoniphilaceae bacterium]MDD7383187.1 DUF951 domain-containing protein [Peptoniphilaceae bacterium]MDY3738411.1 DUF951 domain-containing protein [Peptoniphilaceae bacterium]
MKKYKLNDIVSLKKGHPCGENRWMIERIGADMKLKCLGCDRLIWMKRTDFDKKLRKIQDKNGKMISIVNYIPEDDD